MDDAAVRDVVVRCFQEADRDGNGQLDFEEFKSAVLKNQLVVQSFWQSRLA